MSLELIRPESRQVIDIRQPITAYEGMDWRQRTQELADDLMTTSAILAQVLDKPLHDNYCVSLMAKERTQLFDFIIIESPAELADPKKMRANKVTPSALQLRLALKDGDSEKPVAVFDKDDEFFRLHTWGEPQEITVRESRITVRHQQSWTLWNYNLVKRKQGKDFPGDQWQPDYFETALIAGGENEGEDLCLLLYEFDESIHQLQEGYSRTLGLFEAMDAGKAKRNKIRAELAEALGYSLHETFGQTALQEAHTTLANIRKFVGAG